MAIFIVEFAVKLDNLRVCKILPLLCDWLEGKGLRHKLCIPSLLFINIHVISFKTDYSWRDHPPTQPTNHPNTVICLMDLNGIPRMTEIRVKKLEFCRSTVTRPNGEQIYSSYIRWENRPETTRVNKSIEEKRRCPCLVSYTLYIVRVFPRPGNLVRQVSGASGLSST